MSIERDKSLWPTVLAVLVGFSLFAVGVWSDPVNRAVEQQQVKQFDKIIAKQRETAIPGAGVHDHYYDQEIWPDTTLPDTVAAEIVGDTVIVGMDTIPPPPEWVEHEHRHFGIGKPDEVRAEIGNWITALLDWSQGIVTGLGGWIALWVTWRKAKKSDVSRAEP